MSNNLKKGDRVIVHNSEYNPLTDFYVEEIVGDEVKLKLDYGIIGSFASYNKSQIRKHPIQRSQFTFSISIDGNECNAQNPEMNDYAKYLIEMNNQALIFRAALISLKRILQSFTDPESKIDAIEDLIKILNSHDSLNAFNTWIVPVIESVPEDFSCESILEYSGENIPVMAVYTSESPNNNLVTAVFLVLFTTIMNQIGALSKEVILNELKSN